MENRKKGKGKIVAVIVIVLVVLAAAFCWFSGIVGGISEAEARSIAYEQVPGASDDDGAVVISEFDDARKVYEVQFIHNGVMYEVQVAARNGKVLGYDMEGTGTTAPDVSTQPQTDASEITEPSN